MKILDCSELGLVSGGFGSVSGSAGANNYVDQTYGSMGKLSGGTYVPWNQNTYDCLSAMAQTALWAWGAELVDLFPVCLGIFPLPPNGEPARVELVPVRSIMAIAVFLTLAGDSSGN